MHRRARTFSFAVLSVVAVTVVGAGLAWACTPSGFGTPATPTSTPPTVAPPPAGGPAVAPPAPNVAAPVDTSGSSATGSTSGANDSVRVDVAPRSGATPQAPAAAAPSPFQVRVNGSTAGVSRQGSQVVFSSSKAPAKAAAKPKKAKTAAKPAAKAAVSPRTATADLWSGLAASSSSPISAAEASSGKSGGLGSGVILGLAIVGLGIAGLAGAFVVTTSRRRAASKANTR